MTDIYKAPKAELREPVKAGVYGSVGKAVQGRYHFEIIGAIKEAWANLKGIKTNVLLGLIIYMAVTMVIGGVLGFLSAQMQTAGQGTLIGMQIITQILIMLVGMPMVAGIFMIAIKHSVSAPTRVGEIFRHYDKAFRILWLYILMYIMMILGFVLLVLPGIYLMVAYTMALPLLIEKNMSVWQAMETSRKAISKKWFTMLGFWIVNMFVIMLGFLALMIGVIWALPLVVLAYAIVYRNMFGVEAETLK